MLMQAEKLLLQDECVLNWMRDRVLIDLVSNKPSKGEDLQEKLSLFNLNPFYTFPAIAVLEPSGSNTGDSEKRRISEKIREDLQHQLQDSSVVFTDEEGRTGILFSWASKHVIDHIQRMLNDRFPYPVNIGVGKPCSQLSDVHQSYNQALQALHKKFYKGAGQVIHFSELGKTKPLQDYPVTKEKDLYERMRSADSDAEIERAVNEFYHRILQHGPIDVKDIYELTIRLLVGMEKRALEDAEKANASLHYEIMSIVKMETLQEIKRYVIEYLKELKDVISQNEKESHRSIIKKTLYFMEMECQNATLGSVAQKVYMTPTYLSLLFKMNTGKTFIEQLTDIRIDKAKDMLRNSYLKNYEVAERVGYQDSRYFSQLFKKKVGVSPSEYRASVGK